MLQNEGLQSDESLRTNVKQSRKVVCGLLRRFTPRNDEGESGLPRLTARNDEK